MKSTSRLTRHLNAYKSLQSRIQPDRDSPMLAKDDNMSDYFMQHNKKDIY